MPADASHAAPITFRQLRLKPKTLLQGWREGETGPSTEWQFCAAIEGKGLMLAPPPGQRMPKLPAGAAYGIQGFNGQFDFQFESSVIGLFDAPFVYTLMAWPEAVRARQVRQALRVRTLLPAHVTAPGMSPGSDPHTVAILDLSAAGALIESLHPLGGLGDALRISFIVDVEGEKTQITTEAQICHHQMVDSPSRHRLGLAFRALPRNERLLLSVYVSETLATLDGV